MNHNYKNHIDRVYKKLTKIIVKELKILNKLSNNQMNSKNNYWKYRKDRLKNLMNKRYSLKLLKKIGNNL